MLLLSLLMPVAVVAADAHPTVEDGIKAMQAKDWERAAKILLPLAAGGDAEAQNLVGLLYDNGRYVQVNSCIAAIWYDRAARQGHAHAQKNLAVLYKFPPGPAPNPELAYRWMLLAAAQGLESAIDLLNFVGPDLSPEERRDIKSTMDEWRAEDQPPIDIFIIPSLLGDTEFSKRYESITGSAGC